MQCVSPVLVQGALWVPCGKCRMCKIAKSREWALRISHEISYHEESVFATLTYNDERLPANCSLDKILLQKYFKRLRRRMEPRRIKYFASGEYGDGSGRPHYHAIVFGVSLSEHRLELIDPRRQELGWKCLSGPIYDCWKEEYSGISRGFVVLGTVTYNSARYVVDYCQKAYDKEHNRKVYGALTPPFQIQSQGLGKDWCLEHKEQIMQNVSCTIRGQEVGIPKYYQNKLFKAKEGEEPLYSKDLLYDKAIEKEEEGRHFWREKGVEEEKIFYKMAEGRIQHAMTQYARVDLKRKSGMR